MKKSSKTKKPQQILLPEKINEQLVLLETHLLKLTKQCSHFFFLCVYFCFFKIRKYLAERIRIQLAFGTPFKVYAVLSVLSHCAIKPNSAPLIRDC